MSELVMEVFNRTLRRTWKMKILVIALSITVFSTIFISSSMVDGNEFIPALIAMKEYVYYLIALAIIGVVLPTPTLKDTSDG